MEFIPQKIPEIIVIEPEIHGDHRGYFSETYREDKFSEILGFKVSFIQDNESKSSYGVLRGLHFQIPPFSQGKLVRVIEGKVLDVAVDIRKESPSFGSHVAVELSDKNKRQMFIPRGFAHGFVVLSETAIFSYKVDSYYSPKNELGLAFDDKDLSIDWKIDPKKIRLSDRDANHPKLGELDSYFEYQTNYYE